MDINRVVITGLGLVTPAGLTVEENWEKIVNGQTAIKQITAFDISSFPAKLGGEIKDLDPKEYVQNKRNIRFFRKDVQYCMASARLACEDSGMDLSTMDLSKIGLYVGSGESETRYDSFFAALDCSSDEDGDLDYKKFGSLGLRRIYPSFLLFDLFNNGLCYLSIEYGITGINNNFTYGTSGGNAIGEAFKAIQIGEADIVIAGGHDSLVSCFENYFLYSATGMFTHETSPLLAMKPYSAYRDGFAPSEGAAFVVLESLESATERNAHIRGEIVGYACNCDIHQDLIDSGPQGEGVFHAIRAALNDAKIDHSQVDYINSDGNATLTGDLGETRAFKRFFGERAYDIPVSTIKPITGHTGAASSAVEFVITTMALEKSVIPPTANHTGGDPECDLDYVAGSHRTKEMQYAISVNKGFGGQNCVLVLKRYTASS